MSDPTVTVPSFEEPSVPSNVTLYNIDPPSDSSLFGGGFNANNLVLAGDINIIKDSRRCSVINGYANKIEGKYNTHIIGDNIEASDSNRLYVGCTNGLWVGGKIEALSYSDILCIGDIKATGDVISFFSSDKRLKNNISSLSNCLPKILKLDPISFEWNDKQDTYKGKDIGLIAQQVKEIAPEIVTERKNGYLAMKYEKVIPLLVGAIQDQQKIIEEMRAEIKELKER